MQLVEVREVEQAVDLVDLVGAAPSPWQSRSSIACDVELETSTPHDVAEAPAPQLELDRLEQVVGFVRDLEVGVARDPEDRALEDLHAGEEPVEEVRDHVLERQQPAAVADREEARQPFGNLHAGESLLARLRVAGEHAEAEREARDVREGLARRRPRAASGPGRSRAGSVPRAPRARRDRGRPICAIMIPSSASAGPRVFFQSFDWRAVSSSTRSRISVSASRGVSPSAERTASPDAAWPIRPATRTMKNSSRFDETKRHIFTRSRSGSESSPARSSSLALYSSVDSSRFSSRPADVLRDAVAAIAQVCP